MEREKIKILPNLKLYNKVLAPCLTHQWHKTNFAFFLIFLFHRKNIDGETNTFNMLSLIPLTIIDFFKMFYIYKPVWITIKFYIHINVHRQFILNLTSVSTETMPNNWKNWGMEVMLIWCYSWFQQVLAIILLVLVKRP